jgi:L-amino acid N-acyltransferase YncA
MRASRVTVANGVAGRQGVGSRWVAALADRARAERITDFTALVLADNQLMLKLLHNLGQVQMGHCEKGTVALRVALPATGLT